MSLHKESKATSEIANLTVQVAEHLIDHLEHRYKSYACIYAGQTVDSAAELWLGMWNGETT